MTEGRDEAANPELSLRQEAIIVVLVLLTLYLLMAGPMEWMYKNTSWIDPATLRFLQVIYYPLLLLTDATGTFDWFDAYMKWWRELG